MFKRFLLLLFPPKCVLCGTLLPKHVTDLCHECRKDAPEFKKSKIRISFVARWSAVWYYKDNVRKSMLRYKFWGKRSYAPAYGRALAMHLQNAKMDNYDVLTWVPVSRLRRLRRGYDQVELIAKVVGQELNTPAVCTLKKIRNTPPQSGIVGTAKRRANVLGAYRTVCPENIIGKNILLIDDIITTGATACECARVLLTAGAKSVNFAAIAGRDCD